MPRPKKPTWKPLDAWIYGKTRNYEELVDNPRTKFTNLPT